MPSNIHIAIYCLIVAGRQASWEGITRAEGGQAEEVCEILTTTALVRAITEASTAHATGRYIQR